MPTPLQSITLHGVFYRATGVVTLTLTHPMGGTFLPDTTEAALRSHMAVPSDNWGNDEALAEAQAWADAKWPGAGLVAVWATAEAP